MHWMQYSIKNLYNINYRAYFARLIELQPYSFCVEMLHIK